MPHAKTSASHKASGKARSVLDNIKPDPHTQSIALILNAVAAEVPLKSDFWEKKILSPTKSGALSGPRHEQETPATHVTKMILCIIILGYHSALSQVLSAAGVWIQMKAV